MLFHDITMVDDAFRLREHMYVGIKGDRIAYVSDQPPLEDFGEIYSGKDRMLIPAFYNTHTHLPMFLMRGFGENLPLMDWLQGRIFPFEAHLTDDDIYYATLMGTAEMFRFGIGACSEMYLSQEPQARALIASGAKANLSNSVSWMDNSSYYDLPVYKKTLETIEKYDGADNGRLHVEFALHSEYTTTEKVAKAMAEAAAEHHSTMHVHVSETQGEVDICRKRHQRRSPVRYLSDCGIFDVPTVAAHCVHIDDEDIEILKEHHVTVASCPKSNAKLASGICPVSSLLAAGVNVAIGTDSVASNNNMNMIEEMRFFNLLQKGSNYDPTLITPSETLYAATRAGALAQCREDSGLIREGFKADLTVLDTDKPYMKPNYDLLNNLVYSASGTDVVLTMVDGRICYRDGEYPTLDMERILYECEKSRCRILGDIEKAKIPELQEQ